MEQFYDLDGNPVQNVRFQDTRSYVAGSTVELVAPSKTRRFLDICTKGSDFHYDPLPIVLALDMAAD